MFSLTSAAAVTCGEVRLTYRELQRKADGLAARLVRLGSVVDDFDIAIGSIAIVLDARLATLNVKHMERLAGLAVEDWSAGA